MYRFAIIKSGLVSNVVVSDFEQSTTILKGMLPDAEDVIFVTEETKEPYIGYPIVGGKFLPASPYPSWTFNEDAWQYEPPVARPSDSPYYFWNEDLQNWEKFLPEDIEAIEASGV